MSKKQLRKYDLRHTGSLIRVDKEIEKLYNKVLTEVSFLIETAEGVLPAPFTFSTHPQLKRRAEAIFSRFKQRLNIIIENGINYAWSLSDEKNSVLCSTVFNNDLNALPEQVRGKYIVTNKAARAAFLNRRVQGLNLSERVWKYAHLFRNEIETVIDTALQSGIAAEEMASDLKQFLQYPDKLFRRVRNEKGILQLSKRAKMFNPGQGVYRSSYKNARRYAVTECNMAYRTADHYRWRQLDFVVGIEISLSNNHTCIGRDGKPHRFHDICDELAGKYPKDFQFVGWHPHCRCFATPILKTREEMQHDNERIMQGKEPTPDSANSVKKPPQQLIDWTINNKKRIENAKTKPYFIKDNKHIFKKLID